jgi:multidrug efflux pump subunit AcrB
MKQVIDWMAEHHVATNLLMWFIIITGVLSLGTINMEVFPGTSFDAVSVEIEYIGASPDEIEKSICIKIEEAISGIEGIENISSTAIEGLGTVRADLFEGTNIQGIKEKIKSEVDRIVTFPAESERPIIKEALRTKEVISLVVSGNINEKKLTELANEIKDDLIKFSEISQAEVAATRKYEISILISEETLRSYGLTLEGVSKIIRSSSIDLPGGKVETKNGEILVRTIGKKYNKTEYENIVIDASQDGQLIRLKDIAIVVDGFEEKQLVSRFNGKRATMVKVYRIGDENPIDIANRVNDYVEQKTNSLPKEITLNTWLDDSKVLSSRLTILKDNAINGIILVIICLSLFLEFRLALWVSSGLVISFLGAFAIIGQMGASINMISIFAFILVLGIVVDDAIVVGENIFKYRQKGFKPLEAAKMGVKEVSKPVIFSVSTSIAAFAPLLFISGVFGKLMGLIPIIVISVLTISLIESLLILPAHISTVKQKIKSPFITRINKINKYIDQKLDQFIKNKYLPFLKVTLNNKATTIAIAVSLILVTFGLFRGEVVSFVFFPEIEAENMIAKLELPEGTTFETTANIIERIELGAQQLQKEYDEKYKDHLEGESIFLNTLTTIGQQPSLLLGGVMAVIKPNVGEIRIELLTLEDNPFTAQELVKKWRKYVGDIPGVKSLIYESRAQNVGADIQYRLSAPNYEILERATNEFKQEISKFDGVQEISDDFQSGKFEFKLDLKPTASTFDLTLNDLAQQVRYAFYGAEALRMQRGKHEVRVMVRYPKEQRVSISDIENLRIRTKAGLEIPFSYVANAVYGKGYASIKRFNRQRTITVTADVDEFVANAGEINANIKEKLLPALQNNYEGLTYLLAGAQKEQAKSFASLKIGYILALFIIYSLIAIPFNSYTQPLIIMLAIPFGVIGAVLGHILFGFDLSMISIMGIVALSGIVVNDSLVLIDFINQYKKENNSSLYEAVLQGCVKRFRPILLTSLTTFFGLLPIMIESDPDAQFLIPMAISLGIGVLFATVICLLLIPVGILLAEESKNKLRIVVKRRKIIYEI